MHPFVHVVEIAASASQLSITAATIMLPKHDPMSLLLGPSSLAHGHLFAFGSS